MSDDIDSVTYENGFYDGFRAGLARAYAHVEQLGDGLFENADRVSGEPTNKDTVLRCMSKNADHWMDYADEALAKEREKVSRKEHGDGK